MYGDCYHAHGVYIARGFFLGLVGLGSLNNYAMVVDRDNNCNNCFGFQDLALQRLALGRPLPGVYTFLLGVCYQERALYQVVGQG